MKNPSAQCKYPIPDKNQKHFVPQCIQCPGDTPVPIGAFIPNTLYTLEPPPIVLSIFYNLPQPCPADFGGNYPVGYGSGTPLGGTFSITPPSPGGSNPVTINPTTGTISLNITSPPQPIDPLGDYIITYAIGAQSVSITVPITSGC